MATIVTRAGKGSPLTHTEVDANFTNLNTDKIESGNTVASLTITSADINGGTVDNAAIGGSTPAAGTFTTLTATGQTSLGGAAGAEGLRVVTTASAINWVEAAGGASGVSPSVKAAGSQANIGLEISSKGSSSLRLYTNNTAQEQLRVSHTASAVNYVQVTGAATSSFPVISAQGSDSAVSLGLTAKGGNAIIFFTNSGSNRGLRVSHTASSVNYVDVSGGATGSVPVIGNAGSDSNIGLALKTTGTGAINLAPGSSGVNISNGGTVTAITGTATGTLYTSIPTVTLSAPTTAGGVQATATAQMQVLLASVVSGGTGYTLNDVLTVVGGTGTAAQLTVTGVSSGVITAVTGSSGGTYSALPTNPVSVTGGTGSSATFNITSYGVRTTAYTITNAGSGYVEQPTVTFSGGGGSGAAAYATVGSGTTVRSLGSTLNFVTPTGGTAFSIIDTAASGAAYWSAIPGTGTPILSAVGTSSGQIRTVSAVPIQFVTGGTSSEQLRVAHTASAVNYVQVTGAATGGSPTITPQGSDTNINLTLGSKGTGGVQVQFYAVIGSSYANKVSISGNTTTNAPSISAAGTDTNIDLNLTTKGTGAVRFNTGGGEQARISNTANAVNYVQVTGSATAPGGAALANITFTGSDTNINGAITAKGTGYIAFAGNASTNTQAFRIITTNAISTGNLIAVQGAAAGSAPSIQAISGTGGTDANIDLSLQPKGTGYVQFGTHTATALTISGYIEIKDSAGNVRKLAVVT